MSAWLGYVVIGMGVMRLLIGAAPLFAARVTSRLLGFPEAHDTPTARLMARMFGVRDMGLGVLAFYAVAQPALAAPVFLFNAAMDAGDLASISVPLIRRQGIDRAAWLSAAFAVMGGSAWIVVWSLL